MTRPVALFHKSSTIVFIMSIVQSFPQLIPIVQIVLSILLIGGILLQQSESGLGSAMGGGDGFSSGHHTKRGAEKFIFVSTIVVAVLFVAVSFSLLF
jgi:protein translocase SecG subunit